MWFCRGSCGRRVWRYCSQNNRERNSTTVLLADTRDSRVHLREDAISRVESAAGGAPLFTFLHKEAHHSNGRSRRVDFSSRPCVGAFLRDAGRTSFILPFKSSALQHDWYTQYVVLIITFTVGTVVAHSGAILHPRDMLWQSSPCMQQGCKCELRRRRCAGTPPPCVDLVELTVTLRCAHLPVLPPHFYKLDATSRVSKFFPVWAATKTPLEGQDFLLRL